MSQRYFATILTACIAFMFLVVNSTAYSEPEDPITKLIWLINHEAEKPEMDITQASASNCTPTVETLRLAPDRSIISTSTTVSLSALHGNNSASFLTLGKEDGGAGFSYFVTEETATATYRVDNPSSSKRRWFRKRFGQRCWGNDMCQTDYVPKSLYFRVPSSSPAERTELTDTFRDAIDYCRRQVG